MSKTVWRLTRALRTWWRACSEKVHIPSGYGGYVALYAPTAVVIYRAFFLILLHNHIINIYKKSFSGEVTAPILPPYVHLSTHLSTHTSHTAHLEPLGSVKPLVLPPIPPPIRARRAFRLYRVFYTLSKPWSKAWCQQDLSKKIHSIKLNRERERERERVVLSIDNQEVTEGR